MTLHQLTIKLSKFGNVQIIKEGVVFSLLMTGTGLSKMTKVDQIQKLVIEYTSKKFPLIEAMRNDDLFFCMILKPKP